MGTPGGGARVQGKANSPRRRRTRKRVPRRGSAEFYATGGPGWKGMGKRESVILTRSRGGTEEEVSELRSDWQAEARPTKACPHGWGRPRGHASLKGYSTRARFPRSKVGGGSFCLRMGKEADVEILGLVDQLLDGTALALRVAEEELRDALLVRKLEQRVHEMEALEAIHLGAHFTGQRQVLIETGLIGGVQNGLFHIGHQQGAVEPPGVALAAFKHGPRVAARRQAHEDALLGAPAHRNAVRVQVFLQLPVDHVGGQQQGQFA